jgi:A/G-specific adenine glycosylase
MYEKEITAWFKENKRDLPWRKSDAWGVLVSEIMLQQTPVQRVLPVYQEWMKRWPTPADLAKASPAEVITAWGRLGYPRRALRLHQCAKILSTELGNQLPRTESELRKLPGIGDYTAAAIVAFAFEESSLVLDINIRRLFSRLYRGEESPTSAQTKAERTEYAAYIPKKNAHIWAAATMELGALICTAKKPLCGRCPVADKCQWRSLDYPSSERIKRTQSWHGTDRQCRGTIVQALRDNPTLSKRELNLLWDVPSQVEKAILSLLKDGLIEEQRKGIFSLPQ